MTLCVCVCAAYGVDLVVGGHSHDYERSVLVDGYYGTASAWSPSFAVASGAGTAKDPFIKPAGIVPHKGTVAVVAGSAGQIAGTNHGLNHPANAVLPNGGGRAGAMVAGNFFVDVVGNTLTGTFVVSGGRILDQFYIVKGNRGGLRRGLGSAPAAAADEGNGWSLITVVGPAAAVAAVLVMFAGIHRNGRVSPRHSR